MQLLRSNPSNPAPRKAVGGMEGAEKALVRRLAGDGAEVVLRSTHRLPVQGMDARANLAGTEGLGVHAPCACQMTF